LINPSINFSVFIGRKLNVKSDMNFIGGESHVFGTSSLRVIHTPGHTPGGVCYYDEKSGVIFSGDTLFLQSIGRTDLPLGDADRLAESIQRQIYILPDDVIVYPGHGPRTTIGHEKRNNPFVWM
jgi:glyoxylase-like metal-dependent hydrolase (beta-lactamase superfamily II)